MLGLMSGCGSPTPDGSTDSSTEPGASSSSGEDTSAGPADPNFYVLEEDDAEMEAAMKTAQSTLSFFEDNWKSMRNDGYSLKFAMPTSDGKEEHIWFSPTKIKGDDFTGECANVPVNVPGLNLHDVRTVSREAVSDWMIVVGRKCYGGYTMRVIAKRNPDNAPPLVFVDPPEL